MSTVNGSYNSHGFIRFLSPIANYHICSVGRRDNNVTKDFTNKDTINLPINLGFY